MDPQKWAPGINSRSRMEAGKREAVLRFASIKSNASHLLSFLGHYGKHAQHIILPSSDDEHQYRPILEFVRDLGIETLEIRHTYGKFWRQAIKEGRTEDEPGTEKLSSLHEFPKHIVQQAAKTVKMSPPSFKNALEQYWIKYPRGQLYGDE